MWTVGIRENALGGTLAGNQQGLGIIKRTDGWMTCLYPMRSSSESSDFAGTAGDYQKLQYRQQGLLIPRGGLHRQERRERRISDDSRDWCPQPLRAAYRVRQCEKRSSSDDLRTCCSRNTTLRGGSPVDGRGAQRCRAA